MDKEPTSTEILEAVTKLGTGIANTDKHVSDVLEVINTFSTKMDERFDKVEGRLTTIEAKLTTMPTRDDMNEALANTKADIILTMRKEDIKLCTLVEVLREKKVLSDPDIKRILSLEPFPRLFV